MYVCAHILYVCARIHVCIHVCMNMCVYVCMYVCAVAMAR